MTQNAEQNMQTRDAQITSYPKDAYIGQYSGKTWVPALDEDDLDPDRLVEGPVRYVRCDIANQQQKEAEARGAEGQEPVVWIKQPELNYDWPIGAGVWRSCQLREFTIPLYARPANVDALEARIAELKEAEQLARADAEASKAWVTVLEGENAALRARNTGAAPEPVPYSDPIQTMSTEQICQRLQVLRARWDELMDSDEEMGGGSPMESMDEEMQSLENEISRRSALTREGGV